MSIASSADLPRRRLQRGWCLYDVANSVFPTSVITVFLSLYLTDVAQRAATADAARNGPAACPGTTALQRCDISLLGWHFPAGALWGYLISGATVVLVVVLPAVGALADRIAHRERLMAGLAYSGALTSGLLATVTGSGWRWGVVLFVFANAFYSASVVVYYSLLPRIATALERDAVSSRGWALGYLGSGTLLLGQLGLYLGHDALEISSTAAVRLSFLGVGVWWAVFTTVTMRMLRGLPAGAEPSGGAPGGVFGQLGETLRSARAFPLTLMFLGTYLIYTDGITTVTQVAGQYGKLELGLPQEMLIASILLVQFVAYLGGVLHGRVAGWLGTKRTIQLSLCTWVLVIGGAFFLPPERPIPFFVVGAGIGLVLGGTNALSRSLYSRLIPSGKEGEYFSVYVIGEKATAWLGPLIYASIGAATGSFRYAIIALTAFFVVGLVLISRFPVTRAIEAVARRERTAA